MDECFKPLEEFPFGKLPTLKQVLERCLYFKNYRKDSVQRDVSVELFNLWVNYNVYPIYVIGIKTKLSSYIENFYKFIKEQNLKVNFSDLALQAKKLKDRSDKLLKIYNSNVKL